MWKARSKVADKANREGKRGWFKRWLPPTCWSVLCVFCQKHASNVCWPLNSTGMILKLLRGTHNLDWFKPTSYKKRGRFECIRFFAKGWMFVCRASTTRMTCRLFRGHPLREGINAQHVVLVASLVKQRQNWLHAPFAPPVCFWDTRRHAYVYNSDKSLFVALLQWVLSGVTLGSPFTWTSALGKGHYPEICLSLEGNNSGRAR